MKLQSLAVLWGIFHAVIKLLEPGAYKGGDLAQYLKEIEDGVTAIRRLENQ